MPTYFSWILFGLFPLSAFAGSEFQTNLAQVTLPACQSYQWSANSPGRSAEENLRWLDHYANLLLGQFPETNAALVRRIYYFGQNSEYRDVGEDFPEELLGSVSLDARSQPRIALSPGLDKTEFFRKMTLLHESIHVGQLYWAHCLPPEAGAGCSDLQAISELTAWTVEKLILMTIPNQRLEQEIAAVSHPALRELLESVIPSFRSLEMKAYLLARNEIYARNNSAHATEEDVATFLDHYRTVEAISQCDAKLEAAYIKPDGERPRDKKEEKKISSVDNSPTPVTPKVASKPVVTPEASTAPVAESPRTPASVPTLQPPEDRNYATAGQRPYRREGANILEEAVNGVVNASDPTRPPVRCVRQDPSVRSEPLFLSAAEGNLSKLRQAVAGGAKVNEIKFNRTALSCAIENGKTNAVKWLLEKGANPNLAVRHGLMPIAIASVEGSIARGKNPEFAKMVKLLLTKGAQPNGKTKNGVLPLTYAFGDKTIRQILIAHGGKANTALMRR